MSALAEKVKDSDIKINLNTSNGPLLSNSEINTTKLGACPLHKNMAPHTCTQKISLVLSKKQTTDCNANRNKYNEMIH